MKSYFIFVSHFSPSMKTLSMAGETSWQERIIDLHTIWIPVFLNLQQLTHQVQMHNNDVLVIQNAILTTLMRTDPSKSGSIMHLYMLFCSFPLWNWSYLYTSGARNGYVLNFLLVEWKRLSYSCMTKTSLLCICTWWVSCWRSKKTGIHMVGRSIILSCHEVSSAMKRVFMEGEKCETKMK